MRFHCNLSAVTASLVLTVFACSSDKGGPIGGTTTAAGTSISASGSRAVAGASNGGTSPKRNTSPEGPVAGSTLDPKPLGAGGRAPGNGGSGALGGFPNQSGTIGIGGSIGAASTRASSGTGGVGGARASGGALSSSAAVSSGGDNANPSSNTAGRSSQAGARALGGNVSAGGHVAGGGATATAEAAGSSGAAATVDRPCDIFKSGGTPCVAAHSTVRALFGSYSGKLYQVRRSDNTTKDIVTLSTGGYADGPSQDAFCSGTTCVITVVYDQSGKGNDLWYQGSTAVPGSPQSSPAKATTEALSVSGHKVYSLYINPGNSYWRDGSKSGVPTGSEPEALYMVTSGTHVNGGCCFDYGNSETTRKADAAGAMDAINFSTQCWFGGCSGSGPWVQADLEWGLFPGGSSSWNSNQKAFTHKYVTAMLKNNGTTEFAIKGGNAQSGELSTLYSGKLPSGYSPMKKQGAIVLGSGGDCCKPDGGANLSAGTFYEGAVVSGYPTNATDDAIQSNIVNAGYGLAVANYLYRNEEQPNNP